MFSKSNKQNNIGGWNTLSFQIMLQRNKIFLVRYFTESIWIFTQIYTCSSLKLNMNTTKVSFFNETFLKILKNNREM